MNPFSLEQGPLSVRLDFGFYGAVVVGLALLAVHSLPSGQALAALGWVAAGLLSWTLAEYALHRFVLHGLQPFKGWHARHHARPLALIATPTVLTAVLFAGLVGVPAAGLLALWQASALALGVLTGYLAYILMHHALHHWPGASWLRWPRRWHALHHRGVGGCYGVSLPLWDHVFRTARTATQSTSKAP